MKSIMSYQGLCQGGDWTPALVKALSESRDGLVFPEGEYHFHACTGKKRYCFFSNHDEGVKSLIFLLEGLRRFHLIGEHAEFIFHGRCVPFLLRDCREISMEGFSVDFARSFIPEAQVLESGPDNTVLQFSPEQDFQIVDDRICFVDDEYSMLSPKIPWMAYDLEKMEPAAGRAFGCFENRAEPLAPGIVRIKNMFRNPVPADQLVLKPEPRLCPGIVIDESSDVNLSGIVIHHAGGMGILGQNSRNISLQDIHIVPRKNSRRLISVSDDAVHFAQCSGKLQLENCSFQNQWDDGVNIHGVYRKLKRRGGMMLEAGHFQQFGIPVARAGEHLEIAGLQVKIKDIREINKQYSCFSTEEPFPDVPDGTPVMNLDRQPEVQIRRCTFQANKPRGALVTTMGRAVIEENVFHTPGAAVYLAGNADFWYEAGPVRNMIIRNNLFENCLYQGYCTGRAVIDICPAVHPADGTPYHSGIRIEDNLFQDAHHKMIAASDCRALHIQGNQWEKSERYPGKIGAAFVCSNCSDLRSDIF